MREEDADEPSWFARWEEQLPSPDELMPLSQSLITPDLALAFDIASPSHPHHPPSAPPSSDSPDLNPSAAAAAAAASATADEPARTLKRPRLVWTPQLHKRFVDAVAHLGIKNAVPKTIMQLMSVDGLTRENVASHLQKYRLYLKRMQGLGSSGAAGVAASGAHSADDQLFASAPVPHHFLSRNPAPAAPADGYIPYSPAVAVLQHHHHQMAAAAVAAHQQQYYHQQHPQQRHLGHFGSPPGNGFVDHGFLARAVPQPGLHRMAAPGGVGMAQPPPPPSAAGSYPEDLESGTGGGNRRVLTLFPTNED